MVEYKRCSYLLGLCGYDSHHQPCPAVEDVDEEVGVTAKLRQPVYEELVLLHRCDLRQTEGLAQRKVKSDFAGVE